jgi:hypothetical protein
MTVRHQRLEPQNGGYVFGADPKRFFDRAVKKMSAPVQQMCDTVHGSNVPEFHRLSCFC